MHIARERVRELLARAATKRIAVIGDVMLDVYLEGDVERISPEAPVPVVRIRKRRHALGGAANVAQNVVAIGAACDVVAVVGDDAGGVDLCRMLAETGVDASAVLTQRRPTTTKTRVVARGQQVVRVDEEEIADLDDETVAPLVASIEQIVHRCDALILEDYDKGLLVPGLARAAIECAKRKGIPIVVDPKYRHFFQYGGATVFKPNRRELEAALGAAVDVDHPDAMPDLCARLGVDHLLITLGEQGMALFSEHGEAIRVPTMARAVFDVVGAGDTVTAYLATMLASAATIEEAAVIANVAAGVEVGKPGAQSVTADEVLAHLTP